MTDRFGSVYDIGAATAIYWPDQHPCREPRDQWVVLTPDGGVDLHTSQPRDEMHLLGNINSLPYDDVDTIEQVAKAMHAARNPLVAFEDLPGQYGWQTGLAMQEQWRADARAAVRALQGEA